ncbi:MAG: hypothetical protein H0V82_02295 [Candidatus Protochlamydia sp.]|nr:hypothetical protein [Candidatus Protochlamydia sp.]
MNELREQGQKSIGFKLFGNLITTETDELIIDLNKSFEIQFFPGIAPYGTLTHLGRYDGKKIIVELPDEIAQSNFETICTFLLEKNSHLVVKEYGYEKLGNRKLHLELCYHSYDLLVNVVLFIQGKQNAVGYEIELNPYDLSCSTGEIQNSKKYSQANIMMKELINIKKSEVSKVLAKLKPNNFFVSIERDYLTIDLSPPLKQFIDALGKPSKYQTPKNESLYAIDAYPDEIVQDPPNEKESDPKPSKGSMWFRKMIGKG